MGVLNERKDGVSGRFEGNEGQKQRMYDTLAMITMRDDGKNILITTIANTSIMGKLLRVSPYELEVEVKGRDGKSENLIVMKHFIAYLKFI
ncbi:MAG: hypothetical protein RXP30_01280 [Thermoplasmata archaeon]|nr:hypothetical protein [Euryarchaeota archaeon]